MLNSDFEADKERSLLTMCVAGREANTRWTIARETGHMMLAVQMQQILTSSHILPLPFAGLN